MNFSALERFLDSLVEEKGIPGVDLIVYRHHKPIFRYGAGYSDREARKAIAGDETYFVYSCTKPLTAVCAMQLFENGEFLMDDPLSEFMPEFRSMQVRELDAQGRETLRPARREIMIRDLFTMAAGFNYDLHSAPLERARAESGAQAPTRRMVAALAEQPLYFDPGTRWSYSLCHDVLAALVEVISGMRFETYMKKRLFEPLGMTFSTLHATAAQEKRMARQYRRESDGTVRPVEMACGYVLGPAYDSGGAGLVTGVNDYIRFSDALACGGLGATGERILARASIDLMRTNHLSPAQMRDLTWPQLAGYGYGLGVRTLIDRTRGALSPLGEFGWGGAAGAYTLIDPEREVSLFFAEHMLNSLEPYVHPRLRNLLYKCLED